MAKRARKNNDISQDKENRKILCSNCNSEIEFYTDPLYKGILPDALIMEMKNAFLKSGVP